MRERRTEGPDRPLAGAEIDSAGAAPECQTG